MIEQNCTLTDDRLEALAMARDAMKDLSTISLVDGSFAALLYLTRDPATHEPFPAKVDFAPGAAPNVNVIMFERPRSQADYIDQLERLSVIAASGRAWLAALVGSVQTATREVIEANLPPSAVRHFVMSAFVRIELRDAGPGDAEMHYAHVAPDGTGVLPWFVVPRLLRLRDQRLLHRPDIEALPDEAQRAMVIAAYRTMRMFAPPGYQEEVTRRYAGGAAS